MTVSYGTLPPSAKKYSSMKDVFIIVLLVLLIGGMAFLLLISFLEMRKGEAKRPHIILIIADDLGWDDVSFHGSPEIPTPNLDALAASGIILNKHYVAPMCTPSRASLMTGKYPPNTGLQHEVILAGHPTGLPLNFTILPQYLKRLGYATHLVGKWHLGYYRKEYTPTYRGFDSFFGFMNGVVDYYDYTHYSTEKIWGIDLYQGTKPVLDIRGKYAVELFTEKAEDVIRNHDASQHLFLMLSQPAPHVGNSYQYSQAPPEHAARFKHIKDIRRRIHAGAVSTLEESVGSVFAALDARGFLDNSIVVFFSDNGGESQQLRGGYGSNWPLRGCKRYLWEGGVRVPAIIWSPLLKLQTPGTRAEMMHVSDWLPTLYAAAGGDVRDLGEIDGISMWRHLLTDLPFPRKEVLLNIDPQYGMSSLIQSDLKLINGTHPEDNKNFWYGPSGRENFSVPSMDAWVWKDGSVIRNILQRTGRWLLKTPDHWRQQAIVKCNSSDKRGCNPRINPCLFNITEDPCEENNLASQHPEVVKRMMSRILELNSKSMESIKTKLDPKSDPRCHGFVYVPWLDAEHRTECYEVS